MKKPKGFGLIGILLIIGALILTVGGVVVWRGKVSPLPPIAAPTSSSTLEVANFNLPELIELRKIVGETLSYTKTSANEDQKRLVSQAEAVLGSIQSDNTLQDIIREKTEEDRLRLDFLGKAFATGVAYWAEVFNGVHIPPSPVFDVVTKSAEELGNRIGAWLVLGQTGYVKVTLPSIGAMDILYEKALGVIWAQFQVYEPSGGIYLRVSVEPALVSGQGQGNIILSEGVKPVLENCKVAYRFSNASTPAQLPQIPSQTQATPAQPRTEPQYTDLTPAQIYESVISSLSLTQLQREQNWNKVVGKWVRWSGNVMDVLPNNTVIVAPILDAGSFEAVVNFTPSWSNQLSQLAKDQRIYFGARLVKRIAESGELYGNRIIWGVTLDQGELTVSPIPAPIQGTYIETPEAKGKVVVVSHSWAGNKYVLSLNPGVRIEVKNVSGETIRPLSSYSAGIHLEMVVTFKDAFGNECDLFGEKPIRASFTGATYTKGTWREELFMDPDQTKSLSNTSSGLGWSFFPLSDLDKLTSYEITIVKGKGGKP